LGTIRRPWAHRNVVPAVWLIADTIAVTLNDGCPAATYLEYRTDQVDQLSANSWSVPPGD
jgi:hypothetical protein